MISNNIKVIKGHNSYIDGTVIIKGSGTVKLGKNSQIRAYTVIEMDSGIVSIADNVVIGYHGMIQATGELLIGDDTMVGPNNSILTSHHPQSNDPKIQKKLIRGKTVLGKNVWTGAGVIINDNITIGNNVIIGANSFVNCDIENGLIYAGNPARLIRKK